MPKHRPVFNYNTSVTSLVLCISMYASASIQVMSISGSGLGARRQELKQLPLWSLCAGIHITAMST